MAIVLKNAWLVGIDPPSAERGGLRVEGESIESIGAAAAERVGDEVVDCDGAVVMAGLVNGHTHLYSALATGMPGPRVAPSCFREILERVWWRLDRALDGEAIELSALVGAMDAARCGTTTMIDHHASPNWIGGSLDLLERGIRSVGLRGVLAYEVTDRNGMEQAAAGLEENRRYLERCRGGGTGRGDGRFGGMVGAHAAFTMSDGSLRGCAELAERMGAGVHVHVAEDPCDDRICREQFGVELVERLERFGIAGEGSAAAGRSILAHCTHLSESDAMRLSRRTGAVAHNPRSNMNNAVGYAPIGSMERVQLGTDGIGEDLWNEARAAWLKGRDATARGNDGKSGRAGFAPTRVIEMLAQSARTASLILGRTLGKLEAGAAADVVVTRYVPASPISAENIAGHFLFGMGPEHVREVMSGGKWVARGGRMMNVREAEIRGRSAEAARGIWERMAALGE